MHRPSGSTLWMLLALHGSLGLLGAGPALAESPSLDLAGRHMLDSLRQEALRPTALVAWLALKPQAVVADIGAGPGFLTLEVARAIPGGHVIATDIRADYLAVLAGRARAAKLTNIETKLVRADESGLVPRSVDVALLCQVDQYLADRVAYLRALGAALRPGGRVVLVNFRKYRGADEAAAAAAGFRIAAEWSPSPPMFALALRFKD